MCVSGEGQSGWAWRGGGICLDCRESCLQQRNEWNLPVLQPPLVPQLWILQFLNWRSQIRSYISSQHLHFCWCCWFLTLLCITRGVVGQPHWGTTQLFQLAPQQGMTEDEPSWRLPVGHREEHPPFLLYMLQSCIPVLEIVILLPHLPSPFPSLYQETV